MKNNKGFTLVELIGVLVIIGLLLAVVATPIIGQIRNQRKKLDDASAKVLNASLETYLDDHVAQYPKNEGMVYYVSIPLLVDSGYLKENFVDSSKNILSNNSYVKVTITKGIYDYEILNEDKPNNLDNIYKDLKDTKKVPTYTYMSGLYFKGDSIDNYVYYSGITWRIMGKNYDGSIRLLSNEIITNIQYGSKGTKNFKTSYANEWLNNYFVSRLSNNDIIVKFPWCESSTVKEPSNTDPCVKSDKTKLLNAKVGLLSYEEYKNSLDSLGTSYIGKTEKFATLTTSTDNQFFYIDDTINYFSNDAVMGMRPIINVRKETLAVSGTGTSTDPYVLMKDILLPSKDKTLEQVNITPGEYFATEDKNMYFRVVDVDNNSVKAIILGTYGMEIPFGTNNTFNLESGVGRAVGTSVMCGYSYILKTSTWYQGDAGDSSYKYTYLAKTNYVNGVKFGIPKLGEFFTTSIPTATSFWTMSKANGGNIYAIDGENVLSVSPSTAEYYVRATGIITKQAVIKEGSGTLTNPYIIKKDTKETC